MSESGRVENILELLKLKISKRWPTTLKESMVHLHNKLERDNYDYDHINLGGVNSLKSVTTEVPDSNVYIVSPNDMHQVVINEARIHNSYLIFGYFQTIDEKTKLIYIWHPAFNL